MNCPVCGASATVPRLVATDRLYGTTDREFRLAACAACGLLRLDPAPAPEELGRYYPKNYWFAPDSGMGSRAVEAYRRTVLRDHVRFVLRALRSGAASGPVLDVGCGGGLFLRMLAERGVRVIGLDISEQAAGLAWKHNRVPACCGLLEEAPLAPATVAAVTMFHVVEHLYDPRAYVEAARRLLAPGGRLIVQVPNAASWQFRLLGARWNGIDVPRHLVDYRAQDLEAVLRRSGFRVLRRRHFSLRDNPAGLASSLAPSLDPMARIVRQVPESAAARLLKHAAYFGLVAFSLPFAALEAAAGAGSSIMIEAAPE